MSQDTITPNHHYSPDNDGPKSRGKVVAASVGIAAAVAAAAVGITLAVTHSSSNQTSAAPAPGTSSSSAAQLPVQPVDPANRNSVPAQPADKTTPVCNDGNITITEGPAGVTHNDGEVSVVLDFTNTSSTACTISDYPGAYTSDNQGRQLQVATQIKGNPNSPTHITLQPGQFAISVIAEIPDAVPNPVQLNTAVPGTAVAHTLPFEWPVGTAMTVEPMQVSPK